MVPTPITESSRPAQRAWTAARRWFDGTTKAEGRGVCHQALSASPATATSTPQRHLERRSPARSRHIHHEHRIVARAKLSIA